MPNMFIVDVVNVFEASQLLNCSLSTVRRLVHRGELKGWAAWEHPRAPILIPKEEVLRYRDAHTKAPQ
jgi:excisionase family DNA binding protein